MIGKMNKKQRLKALESKIDEYLLTQEPEARITVPASVVADMLPYTEQEIRCLYKIYKDAGFSHIDHKGGFLYLYTDMDSISKASINSILGQVSKGSHVTNKGNNVFEVEELPVHYKYWKTTYC